MSAPILLINASLQNEIRLKQPCPRVQQLLSRFVQLPMYLLKHLKVIINRKSNNSV